MLSNPAFAKQGNNQHIFFRQKAFNVLVSWNTKFANCINVLNVTYDLFLTGGVCLHWDIPPLLECVVPLVLANLHSHLIAPATNLLKDESQNMIDPARPSWKT